MGEPGPEGMWPSIIQERGALTSFPPFPCLLGCMLEKGPGMDFLGGTPCRSPPPNFSKSIKIGTRSLKSHGSRIDIRTGQRWMDSRMTFMSHQCDPSLEIAYEESTPADVYCKLCLCYDSLFYNHLQRLTIFTRKI